MKGRAVACPDRPAHGGRRRGGWVRTSYVWNDAERWKIGCPCWTATTLRVVNDLPSRIRSTL